MFSCIDDKGADKRYSCFFVLKCSTLLLSQKQNWQTGQLLYYNDMIWTSLCSCGLPSGPPSQGTTSNDRTGGDMNKVTRLFFFFTVCGFLILLFMFWGVGKGPIQHCSFPGRWQYFKVIFENKKKKKKKNTAGNIHQRIGHKMPVRVWTWKMYSITKYNSDWENRSLSGDLSQTSDTVK